MPFEKPNSGQFAPSPFKDPQNRELLRGVVKRIEQNYPSEKEPERPQQ